MSLNNTPYPEDLKDKFYEHHQWIESHMDEDYYDQLNLLPRYIEKLFVEKLLFIHYEIENQNWRLVLKDRLVQLLKIVKKILLNYLKDKDRFDCIWP